MIVRRLKLPRPHAAQRHVLDTRKRFNVLCMGRQWGKTTISIECVVRATLTGKPVAWFSPTYRSLSDAWRQILATLDPISTRKNDSERRLELIGGGSLECWSLDNSDAGRGRAYAALVVDEAAMVKDLETAWEQSMRPMLSAYQGEAWFLSTPKGTANYFHSLYQRGKSEPDWASWQMPTETNPFIAASEIAAAKADLTDLAFAQEYLAQFVSWAGAVFRRITDAVGEITAEPAAMIGVDWGRTGDSTVFTALSARGHVVAMERFRGVEYALQRQRLAEFWRRTGGQCWIVAEQNSMGGPVVEQLQRDGLPVVGFSTTSASKAAIIERLALAFERGTITIPNDPVLIGELQAFEGSRSPSGLMRYGAPAGVHDDCVMSLAIGWAALQEPRERQQYWDANAGGVSDQYVPYQISSI